MIKTNIELDISRDELMSLIQMYFEKLYDARIVIRGRTKRGGGAYYVSLPIELVRKYNLENKKFRIVMDRDSIVYIEDEEGVPVKNFGNKRWASYYIVSPVKFVGRVKILVEQENPLKIRVILPISA